MFLYFYSKTEQLMRKKGKRKRKRKRKGKAPYNV